MASSTRRSQLLTPSPSPTISSHEEDWSPLDRQPSNPWTNLQKVTLVLLIENYRTSWTTTKLVFNETFKQEIPSRFGLSQNALRTYYWGIKRGSYTICGDWQFLKNAATEILDAKLNVVNLVSAQNDTEAGDPARDVTVLDRAHPPDSSLDLYTQLMEHIREDEHFLPSPEGDAETIESILAENANESVRKAPVPFRAWKLDHSSLPFKQDNQKIPLLGFRAFSNISQGLNSRDGFMAGVFHAGMDIIQPDPSSSANKHLVFRHVERGNRNLSPFISLTENPLAAVHRALRMGSQSFIAIVDLHLAGRVGEHRHPGQRALVQSVVAANIYRDTGYRGTAEWLVWKQIERHAILSIVPVKRLLSLPPQMPGNEDPFGIHAVKAAQTASAGRHAIFLKPISLNFHSGRAVAQLLLLLRVPLHFFNDAVSLIIKDWKILDRRQDWTLNEPFCAGLQSIKNAWVALAGNSYDAGLESLQVALYGRVSQEYEERRNVFTFKDEDMAADETISDIGAASSFDEHADMEMDPGTPPTSEVCENEKVPWSNARIDENGADVMEYEPGPWAEGLGRWRLLRHDNDDDDCVPL